MQKLKIVIIVLVLGGMMAGYYFYLSNKTAETEKQPQKTEQTQETATAETAKAETAVTETTTEEDSNDTEILDLISQDLEKDYPKTPAAVLKLFCSIQKCYYNKEYSEKQLKLLSEQSRKLFSEELLKSNPEDTYYSDLKTEISNFKNAATTMDSYVVEKSESIKTKEIDGVSYAQAEVTYLMKKDSQYTSVEEQYILLKDKNKCWKIVGWNKKDTSNASTTPAD